MTSGQSSLKWQVVDRDAFFRRKIFYTQKLATSDIYERQRIKM